MKIDVFGTCVTRDAFTYENNHHQVGKYSSRSSLISAIQQPVNIKKTGVKLESAFFERVVQEDLDKTFKSYARNPKSKVVIIDLIQERHPINILEGIGITSYSTHYAKSKLPKGKIYKHDQKLRMFLKHIKKIAALFDKYETVILHEVNLGTRYITKNGDIAPLELRDVDEYFIKKGYVYYDTFKKFIPNIKTIKIDGFLIDENNRWGPGPSHFQNEYYLKFNEGLDHVLNYNEDFYFKKE